MVQTSMFLRFRNISGNRVRVRVEEKDTIECAENETLQSNHGSGNGSIGAQESGLLCI